MQGLMGKCQWLSVSQAKFSPLHKGLRDTTHSQSLAQSSSTLIVKEVRK